MGEILQRLDDRLSLLRDRRPTIEHHRTLRATVEWSYQLLDDQESVLFDRLAIFAGSFDLPAAEAVCAHTDLRPHDILDVLSSLVEKSMVVVDRATTPTRYRVLETLRQYADSRLIDRGEYTAVAERHIAHFSAVAEQAAKIRSSPEQSSGEAIFEREWDNLRVAASPCHRGVEPPRRPPAARCRPRTTPCDGTDMSTRTGPRPRSISQ